MINTGMLRTKVMSSTPTGSAPGKATRVKKIDQARVEPMGAEMTALKMVASSAEAERTNPVLLRTNSRLPGRLSVAMATLHRLDRNSQRLTPALERARVEHNRTELSSLKTSPDILKLTNGQIRRKRCWRSSGV